MHYKTVTHLPKYDYIALSDDAKVIARAQILQADREAITAQIQAFKAIITNNVHAAVNDRNTIPYLIRRKAHINRTMSNVAYMEKYILGNLCQFLSDGQYVTFAKG